MNVLLHRYFIYDDAAWPFTSLRLSDLISFSNWIKIFFGSSVHKIGTWCDRKFDVTFLLLSYDCKESTDVVNVSSKLIESLSH